MSGLDAIPEENSAWDYYYKIYYEDDEDADDFLPPENQNYKYTTPMAEGGYDPTTENETPWEDHWIDIDDDDEEEVDTTRPFQPPASSTPYHGGEEHEMTHLSQEQSGAGDTIPLLPEFQELTDPDEREGILARAKEWIRRLRPNVDFSKIVLGFGKTSQNRRKIVAFGPKGGETSVFKQDNTLLKGFSDTYSGALGPRAEDILAADNTGIREERQRLKEEKEVKEKEQQISLEQKTKENVQNLRNRIEQTTARREALEEKHGSNLEQQNEIDRLKHLEKNLQADLKKEENKWKETQKKQKQLDKQQARVDTLRKLLSAKEKGRNDLEARLNATKPLDTLKEQEAEIKKQIEEDRRVIEDENTSPSERQAAEARVEEREEDLVRLRTQVQEREEALPLRERVKNIFKKYGWTLQAVVLAAGLVLSALALAGLKGLKAGTKAVGQGLNNIGQKLGSQLPGLIGSIVSFIFKAAGSVIPFLAEHALPWWPSWLKGSPSARGRETCVRSHEAVSLALGSH